VTKHGDVIVWTTFASTERNAYHAQDHTVQDIAQGPEILMIPVAHDPLCGKILQNAGFKVIGCAGYANSATLIAEPDVELLTLTEMVDAVWRMADAVDLPVWADGDTGHGNTTNVQRTVRQMEKAGAVSLMLEDQVSPKRCGHMSGKEVIPTDEWFAKIKAALDTRIDGDFTVLARTTRPASVSSMGGEEPGY
jgi:2,3-dimethylmalate lyase